MFGIRKVLMLPAIVLLVLAYTNTNLALAQPTATQRDIEIDILKQQLARAKAEAEKAIADAEKARADAAKAKAEADRAQRAVPLSRESEANLRRQIGANAVAQIDDHGQDIATGAFSYAIGKVPYRFCRLVGVAGIENGYQATVKLYYTNSLKSDFYMEIVINYDSMGGFRSWRIGYCTDSYWQPKWNDKLFDRLLK